MTTDATNVYESWDVFLRNDIYRESPGVPPIKHARAIGKAVIADLHSNPNEQGA